MLISYYANKKSSPRLPSWQPSLIFFNIPIESGTIIKPCTLKHFQVTYMLHKAGYWTKAITWTNADSLTTGPLRTNFWKVWIKIQTFCQENAFENVVCKMAAILFMPHVLKYLHIVLRTMGTIVDHGAASVSGGDRSRHWFHFASTSIIKTVFITITVMS